MEVRPPLQRRFGARNTNRLNPNLPPLAAGDAVPFYPGMPMTVALADPPRALALWLVTSANRRSARPGPGEPSMSPGAGAFVLAPVDASTTRLLTRTRVTYQPAAKWAPYVHLLLEPGHLIMGRRQVLGLRQRAKPTSW
jgi:hypothetical protein